MLLVFLLGALENFLVISHFQTTGILLGIWFDILA